jgi:hypothetical protein
MTDSGFTKMLAGVGPGKLWAFIVFCNERRMIPSGVSWCLFERELKS